MATFRRGFLFILLALSACHVASHVENNSSSGIGEDVADSLEPLLVEDTPEFSTLDAMLQWAISHSDPEKLSESASEISSMTPEQLALKRSHIKDVVDAMRMPSAADLMKVALADLEDGNKRVEDQLHALYELLELVEPIDSANDFVKLDGLKTLATCFHHSDAEIRTMAAWVLGIAAQNNPTVQIAVLESGLLPLLIKSAKSTEAEEVVKALFSISACVRNHHEAQSRFNELGGQEFLGTLLVPGLDVRVHRKALALLADLAEEQTENEGSVQSEPSAELVHRVVDLLDGSMDLDLLEKGLHLLKSLASFSDGNKVKIQSSGGGAVLERMAASISGEGEFVKEMEVLRRHVIQLIEK